MAIKNYTPAGAKGFLPRPATGSPLYHVTTNQFKDASKFNESPRTPVTWFTSGSKGYNGHHAAKNGLEYQTASGEDASIHIRKMHSGVKLANEHEIQHSIAAVHGGKPEDHEFPGLHLDPNLGEHSASHVNKVIKHLKSRGFDGVVHSDSWLGHDDHMAVGLFHPNKHSTHVKTVKSVDDIDAHQNEYEKGLKK